MDDWYYLPWTVLRISWKEQHLGQAVLCVKVVNHMGQDWQ